MANYIRVKIAFDDPNKKGSIVHDASLLNLDKVERFAKNEDGTISAVLPTYQGKGEQYILSSPSWVDLQTILQERGLLPPLPPKV